MRLLRPDDVRDHRALPHEQIARPVQDQGALLLFGLHRLEACVGAGNGFVDRLCIGRITPLAFNERPHIVRRDQPDVMAKCCCNLPCATMRRGAGFPPDRAKIQLAQEIKYGALWLKGGLGQSNSKCCHFPVGDPFSCWSATPVVDDHVHMRVSLIGAHPMTQPCHC